MSKMMEHFTCYRASGDDGERWEPPDVPAGHVAVPYVDMGYHGGEYWAILPIGWTPRRAREIFESEGHINELYSVAGKRV